MLEQLKKEANLTLTENGAVSYASTGSECLDLFATIGALRRASDDEIVSRFIRAYSENPDSAMKLLFFARDIRGGLGERRVFRVAMNWLADNHPESVIKNLIYFAEYGRFDDLFSLVGTGCEGVMFSVIARQFKKDMRALENGEAVSLLGKWLPSVNASSVETKALGKKTAKNLHLSEAEYRKSLTALRKAISIIENNLRLKDYTFDYAKQPSRAMFKYRLAFYRNDGKRYNEFLQAVNAGTEKLHADTVAPYELIRPYLRWWEIDDHSFVRRMSDEERDVLNATWKSLTDFSSDENAIAVVDTSGSMCYGQPVPIAVAYSLGLYFAEHNTGAFKNHFIEFSARPQLIELNGETFADKLQYIGTFNEIANTNLESVFDLILDTAVKNKVPQKELPTKIIIISDMEFDQCIENATSTVFENAKQRFEETGYKLPQVVFWNVANRNRQQPVTQNEQGVALVSGVTPRLFSMVANNKELSPYKFMMEVLESDRYKPIVA